MPVIVLCQKVVAGFIALIFLFNLNIFKSDNIDIKMNIFRHEENVDYITFFGVIYVNGEEGAIIVQIDKDSGNKTTTINKNENKEDKKNQNTIIKKENNTDDKTITKDDKTPGRFKVTIQNKKGEKVNIDRDYGSGEKSEFDKQLEKQILDEVTNYIKGMNNKSLRERLFGYVNGFKDYCNKDNSKKGLKKWF